MAPRPMVRVRAIVVVAAALAAGATGFTINDKVYVEGALLAESSGLDSNQMCREHTGTHLFKVCGCGMKVVAHLLMECQSHKQYDTQIGKCDCSSKACDNMDLKSGYGSKLKLKAASFEIAAC